MNKPVRCAIIDCNSESLGIFKRQLSYLPDVTLSAIFEQGFSAPRLDAFYAKGGRLIPFDYMIDRGSLIHIEELVSRLLREKYS